MISTVLTEFPNTSLAVHEIISTEIVESLLKYLGSLTGSDYHANTRSAFPGPNPVSMDTGDFGKLRAQPYFIAEKTDGVRALCLVCTIDAIDIAVLLDRTVSRAYIFPVKHMPRALFQGTLFDGELIYDTLDGVWNYIIFDALCVSGVPVFHFPFSRRMHAVETSLTAYVYDPAYDAGQLRLKCFIPLHCPDVLNAFETHEERMKQRHSVDGVVFMPELDRVVFGRHDNLLKIKSVHSVDFLCGKKGEKLLIYDEKNKRHRQFGTPTEGTKHLASEGAIVECILPTLDNPHVWEIIKVRKDKDKANNRFTLDKTMLNMQEQLTLEKVLTKI